MNPVYFHGNLKDDKYMYIDNVVKIIGQGEKYRVFL